jgi:hypothetical protein
VACQVGTALVTAFATHGEHAWLTYRCSDCDLQFNRTVSRCNRQVSRVQVRLADENSDKGGSNDKRCMIEARLDGVRRLR